jgi:hypothetical protein
MASFAFPTGKLTDVKYNPVETPAPVKRQVDNESLSIGYSWSLSGREYVIASKELRPLFEDYADLQLSLFLGTGTKETRATAWGPGLTWKFQDRSGFYLALQGGLFLSEGQKPDVAGSLLFGIKF